MEQRFGVCWGGRTLLGRLGGLHAGRRGRWDPHRASVGAGGASTAGLIPAPPTEIREAFKVFDRDGNGFISKQELGTAMRSLGYMPNEVELEVIIQRLDMDGRTPGRRDGDRDGTPRWEKEPILPYFHPTCWTRHGMWDKPDPGSESCWSLLLIHHHHHCHCSFVWEDLRILDACGTVKPAGTALPRLDLAPRGGPCTLGRVLSAHHPSPSSTRCHPDPVPTPPAPIGT